MESGKTEIRRAPMNVNKMVGECVELMKLKVDENNNRLAVTVDPDIPAALVGDEFRIRQILINLMSNAANFTVDGRISLSAEVTGRGRSDNGEDCCTVQFMVADTGIGMSDEFLEKIFTPFEQEDSFLSRRYEGSGLGLSICHNLAGLMGGDMNVESKLGEGSRFTFHIPFVLAENQIETEKEETAKDTVFSFTGKRVLLVDDIEINREIMREVLADTGVELEEACDGEDAYTKFMRSPVGYYDCILMDIQMPKMDGYTTSRAIRASDRADNAVPIIAMTANALKEDIDRAIAAGMSDHTAKPIDFDECMTKLKKWCYK
jgi:CheY-like chemotaxis protein